MKQMKELAARSYGVLQTPQKEPKGGQEDSDKLLLESIQKAYLDSPT